MKTTTLGALGLVALLFSTGCGESGSGKAGSETRSLGEFEEIELHAAIRGEVTVGASPSVVVTGDDNLVPLIETTVVGDRLIVRPSKAVSYDLPMRVIISCDELNALDLHGASSANVAGLDADELSLGLHGASSANLAGETDELVADLHGASRLDAQKLEADDVEVRASGASSVELGEPDSIDALLSGASSLRHAGTPEIKKQLSGASTIKTR